MIWVGTAGYHYQDWRGTVYPPGVKEMLTYYTGLFPFTEINVTFYRLLTPVQTERMAAKAPPPFRFFIKAFQGLTHRRDEARDALLPFRESLTPLAERGQLAGILLQFPNSFRPGPERRDYLRWLRDALGPADPVVVEFRHREWTADPETFDLLRSLGLSYACVDEPQFKGLVPPVAVATASPAYVRFHGRNYRKWWAHAKPEERYDYLYSEAELAGWTPRILELHRQTELVYVSMNNHRGGQAVINGRMIAELLTRAGAPVQPAPGPPPAFDPAFIRAVNPLGSEPTAMRNGETQLAEIARQLRCEHECPLGTPGQVPGEGPVGATVMFIGEAPGEQEAVQGRPLVGRAGQVFNQLLEQAGLRREQVFITNLLKCRPPENRAPRAAEVRACLPFLLRQVEAVNPRVLAPMGSHALKALAGPGHALKEVHGRPMPHGQRVLFPLFHPASAFYRQELRETLRTDMQALGEYLRQQGPR